MHQKKSSPQNYVCIFPTLMNYLLIKDVGMIPYTLSKYFGYNAVILTYKNDNYTYLENNLNEGNFSLDFMEKRFNNEILNVISYLIKKSPEIDVLEVYHLRYMKIFLYSLIYKIFNGKGKFYVKIDANDSIISFLSDRKGFKPEIRRKFTKLLFKYLVDLLSIETSLNYEKLIKSEIVSPEKLIYLPNGVENTENIDLSYKKNYILNVGRLGTYEKATETLLDSLSKIEDFGDWKVILLGELSESFNDYLEGYFKDYPHLINKIIFKGHIENREETFKYYAQSKIFCFPSRTESFGIALLEAAYFADYLITTDVGGARDILNITGYGEFFKVDDSKFLSERLQDLMNHWKNYEKDPNNIKDLVAQNFSWYNLCKKLHEHLNK